MRNDVKLGFAIGGVLLAVLIVYVLVVPNGSNPRQAKSDRKATDSGKVTLEPTLQSPPAAPAGEYTPGGSAGGAATQPGEIASANGEKTADPIPPARSRDIDWNKLLNDQPVLMTETPLAAGGAHQSQGGEGRSVTSAIEPARASTPQLSPEPLLNFSATTRPSGGIALGARTHVVQRNETLSSISAAAYGSQNFWPAIVKANPGIDPNHLKVGATLNLPQVDAARSSDAQSASARISPSAAQLDAKKQYRVQAGDSLHKISVKLYGKSTLADKIYELNKQTIGDDPAKLKVGQVLQLPEPPTVTASR